MYAGKQTVALYKINNNNTNKKLMISFGGRSFIKAQISQCQSINKTRTRGLQTWLYVEMEQKSKESELPES